MKSRSFLLAKRYDIEKFEVFSSIIIVVLYDFNFIGKIRRFLNKRFIENNSVTSLTNCEVLKYKIEILILDIKACSFSILFLISNFYFSKGKISIRVIWYCRLISSSTNMIPLKIQRYRNTRLHARFLLTLCNSFIGFDRRICKCTTFLYSVSKICLRLRSSIYSFFNN